MAVMAWMTDCSFSSPWRNQTPFSDTASSEAWPLMCRASKLANSADMLRGDGVDQRHGDRRLSSTAITRAGSRKSQAEMPAARVATSSWLRARRMKERRRRTGRRRAAFSAPDAAVAAPPCRSASAGIDAAPCRAVEQVDHADTKGQRQQDAAYTMPTPPRKAQRQVTVKRQDQLMPPPAAGPEWRAGCNPPVPAPPARRRPGNEIKKVGSRSGWLCAAPATP